MSAVCVMRDIKPDKVNDPAGTGQKVQYNKPGCFVYLTVFLQILDYWGPSKKLLGDMSFLNTLKEYDKDNIPVRDNTINTLLSYVLHSLV